MSISLVLWFAVGLVMLVGLKLMLTRPGLSAKAPAVLALLIAQLPLAGCAAEPPSRAAEKPQHKVETPRRTPEEAAGLVREGKAVLVDVREPAEWKETGVAEPAATLALSDLRGERARWKPFLEENGGRELILYCRSGNRSSQAAELLSSEGFKVSNAGGLRDWIAAGLPVREP